MIDWTKPIRAKGDHRAVHVISSHYVENPGDEPVALIRVLRHTHDGKPRTSEMTPLKRNLDGTPHPAQGRRGSAVELENVPTQTVMRYNAKPATDNIWRNPFGNLQLTFEGDNLVKAEIIDD